MWLGLAESLAISHGDENIRIHCLCPQAVDTAMSNVGGAPNPAMADGMLSTEQVAECVMEAFAKETFLILPHAKVAQYLARKAQDLDKWLSGMRKWRKSML